MLYREPKDCSQNSVDVKIILCHIFYSNWNEVVGNNVFILIYCNWNIVTLHAHENLSNNVFLDMKLVIVKLVPVKISLEQISNAF